MRKRIKAVLLRRMVDLPGMVLSSTNATDPPTNMAVVRRTFSTWSTSTMPGTEVKIGLGVKIQLEGRYMVSALQSRDCTDMVL